MSSDNRKMGYGVSRYKGAWAFNVEMKDGNHRRRHFRQSGFPTRQLAEDTLAHLKIKLYRERRGEVEVTESRLTKLGKAAQEFKNLKRSEMELGHQSLNPRSKVHFGQLNKLDAFVELIGSDTPLREISRDDLQKWVEHERARAKTFVHRAVNTYDSCLPKSHEKLAEKPRPSELPYCPDAVLQTRGGRLSLAGFVR